MKFTYAGIPFQLARTNSWNMEPVYTDDGADYLYTRHTIDVECIANPQAIAYALVNGTPVSTPGSVPAGTFKALRHVLLQPRQTLLVTDGIGDSVTVLQSPAAGKDVDQELGPKPLRCDVRIAGASRTWAFRWVVQTTTFECPGGGNQGIPELLGNRWSDEHHINQDHLCTRVVTGKAIFRSDILEDTDALPDHFREVLGVVTPAGFQRVSVDVVAQSDGRALAYTIREEELMADLGETDAREDGDGLQGSGILRIEGACGVSSIATDQGPPGGMTLQQIDLRAYGNKFANQWTMVQRLWQLATTKMSAGGGQLIGTIRHASVRQSMGLREKWSEITIAFQATPPQGQQNQIGGLNLDPMKKDISDIFQPQGGVNPAFPRATGMRGSADIELLTNALQDACAPLPANEDDVEGDDGGEGEDTGGPEPETSFSYADSLPEEETRYSDQGEYPYTLYRASVEIERSTGLVQAPPSGSQSGGSSGGTTAPTPTSSDDWGGANGSFEGAAGSSQGQLAPCRFFRFAWPMETMKVTFEAERLGEPPLIPSPKNSDSNLVLLWAHLNPLTPVVANDGYTSVYKVQGTYEYGLQTPIQPGADVMTGALPWTTLAFTDTKLVPDNFGHGVFDDPDGPGSGGGGPGNPGLNT